MKQLILKSIKNQIFFYLSASLFLVTTVILSTLYFFLFPIIKNQVHEYLMTVSKSKAEYINFFLEEQKEKIRLFTNQEKIIDFLVQANDYQQSFKKENQVSNDQILIAASDQAKNTVDQKKINLESAFKDQQQLISSELKDSLSKEFFNIFLINKDGKVAAASDVNLIDEDKSLDDYFTNAQSNIYIKDAYYSSQTSKNLIAVSAPIFKDKEFLGVVVAEIDTIHLDLILLKSKDLKESGEFYLINQHQLMITPSKFLKDTFLEQKVNSVVAKQCFIDSDLSNTITDSQNPNIYANYRNYRDEAVIGTYVHLPVMDWCLLAEIDQDEAFQSSNQLIITIIVVASVFTVLISLGSLWIGKIVSQPLLSLRDGAQLVADGNLDYQIESQRIDEIGELARAFNQMTAALKNSRKDIDQKIEEQTKKLLYKQVILKDQQKAIMNILEDVEEEKHKAEAERDKAETILHSIGDGVFVVDQNFKIIIFNQAAEKISGLSADKVIGHKWNEVLNFISEEDHHQLDLFNQAPVSSKTSTNLRNNTLLVKKDKNEVPIANSVAVIKDDNDSIFAYVVVFRDITQEKEIDQMKTDFLSVAAHQLRTPLGSMRWNLEMINSGDMGKINHAVKEVISEVYNGLSHLVSLVDDLLNISRIDQGRLADHPQKTNLIELINQVIKLLKAEADHRKIKIVFKAKDKKIIPEIMIDWKRLQEAVTNVISNAIKYNKDQGKVEINLQKSGQFIEIKISDTGIGIPEKDQYKLFSKFFRADNAVRSETEGSGLGLFMVKSYVEAWGGSLDFMSKVGKGSTFIIKLPLRPKQHVLAQNLKVKSPNLK